MAETGKTTNDWTQTPVSIPGKTFENQAVLDYLIRIFGINASTPVDISTLNKEVTQLEINTKAQEMIGHLTNAVSYLTGIYDQEANAPKALESTLSQVLSALGGLASENTVLYLATENTSQQILAKLDTMYYVLIDIYNNIVLQKDAIPTLYINASYGVKSYWVPKVGDVIDTPTGLKTITVVTYNSNYNRIDVTAP